MRARRLMLVGVLAVAALSAGCSAGTTTTTPRAPSSGTSASPTSSTGPSAPAAPAEVELAVDPGAAAYRALDVCALVPEDVALGAAETASWNETRWHPGVLGTCSLDDGTDYVYVRVGMPRDRLPSSITAPNPVSETVDRTAEGAVVVDAACVTAWVAAGGYLLDLEVNSPATHDTCSVMRTLAASMRTSLAGDPPTYGLADTDVGSQDLCAAFEGTRLAATLRAPVVPTRADSRQCLVGTETSSYGVVFQVKGLLYGMTERGDGFALSEDGCTAAAKVTPRSDAAERLGSSWVGVQLRLSGCDGAEEDLRDAVRTLASSGG